MLKPLKCPCTLTYAARCVHAGTSIGIKVTVYIAVALGLGHKLLASAVALVLCHASARCSAHKHSV